METPLRARLLGRPSFESGGIPVACPSRKALGLAAFILYTRAMHSRSRLATLFWGMGSPRHASGSLRVALTKLPPALLDCLVVERDGIGLAPGAAIAVDVELFLAQCAAPELAVQTAALGLYSGALLEGLEDDAAPEFSDWLAAERMRLKQSAHDAHLRVAQAQYAAGERARAREVADAWLRHDPSSEAMHRMLMGWLAQGEGSDQALAQYELYRRARAVAHGAAPSEEMALMAERLRRGGERPARESSVRLGVATSFFGRTGELAELRGLLADPACRLLTLHGIGGVGKTRLAVALAESEGAMFSDGVHLVALDAVQTPALFAHALASACGLQPSGAAAPLDAVAGYLADRSVLLVLDNLEHLLHLPPEDPGSIPSQVAALLRDTGPHVKLVATSREPLRLQEEWLYPLEGLPYPPPGAGADAQGGYAAVQFFAQRARQAYIGFSLASELPNVVQVCEALEGLPLGLELAASWVRDVPCAEIAAGLRERAAAIRNRHANRAARHQSLGAVVAYSWERLPAEQREALTGLAVLHGSFSREAAENVAQAGLRALSALTEKSLLRRVAGGRWHMHEVVRQFAWDQPDVSPKARVTRQAALRKRRDAFYLGFLRDVRAQLEGPEEGEALASIEGEAANIRPAWESAARERTLGALEEAAAAWFDFLECRSIASEGVIAAEQWHLAAAEAGDARARSLASLKLGICRRFAAQVPAALETLDAAVALSPVEDGLRGQLLAARAFTLFLLGRLADAEADARGALAIAEAATDPTRIAAACRTLGLVLSQTGRREEGREAQRRALESARAVGRPSLLASAHNNLALAENVLGHYGAAESGYESALACWRELHWTSNVGRAMHNLGVVAGRRGDYPTALTRYRAALDVLRKAGDRNLIALNLMSTGDALVRLGQPLDARVPLMEALRMAERDNHMLPALDARIVLAQAALALGEPREAARHLLATFEVAHARGFTNVLADAVVVAGRWSVAVDGENAERAHRWAADIARCPEASLAVQRDAKAFEEELAAQAPTAMAAPLPLAQLAEEARAAVEAGIFE
jgi:predicted ATPase/DNA-binding SARP family transcriptional activator